MQIAEKLEIVTLFNSEKNHFETYAHLSFDLYLLSSLDEKEYYNPMYHALPYMRQLACFIDTSQKENNLLFWELLDLDGKR